MMKFNLLIIFSPLLFFSCARNIKSDACIDKKKIDQEIICTMQYEPVCGCDNITYGNACEAERSGVLKWERGECNN